LKETYAVGWVIEIVILFFCDFLLLKDFKK